MARKGTGGNTGRNRNAYCSFCRKSYQEVGPLVEGPGDVYICGECIELCQSIIEQEKRRRGVTKPFFAQVSSPQDIQDKLDQYLSGQQSAKKVLSVAAYDHSKRVGNGPRKHGEEKAHKSHVLLVGPNGSGKALVAQTLAQILEVPFVSEATAALTDESSAVEPWSFLLNLLRDIDFDIVALQLSIVYIDEVDKIAKSTAEGIPHTLLQMLEGNLITISPQTVSQSIQVDSSNILFICGGTFAGLDRIIARRAGSLPNHPGGDAGELLSQVTPDDLIEFGMRPEFVELFPHVAALIPLDEKTLMRMVAVASK